MVYVVSGIAEAADPRAAASVGARAQRADARCAACAGRHRGAHPGAARRRGRGQRGHPCPRFSLPLPARSFIYFSRRGYGVT